MYVEPSYVEVNGGCLGDVANLVLYMTMGWESNRLSRHKRTRKKRLSGEQTCKKRLSKERTRKKWLSRERTHKKRLCRERTHKKRLSGERTLKIRLCGERTRKKRASAQLCVIPNPRKKS